MIGDLPIPISRAPSSMSIPAAPLSQDQIKPLLASWGEKSRKRVAGTKRYQKKNEMKVRSNNSNLASERGRRDQTRCEERSDTWNESSQAERERRRGFAICDVLLNVVEDISDLY